MELFGVQELPNSRSINAPGWAYVADPTVNPSKTLATTSRKRAARNQVNGSSHENTARQDAKILRDLLALDKESYKDVHIPVPVRHRDNAGRVSHGKVTPGVRKILQSQKTFANHLSDAEALALQTASSASGPTPATPAVSRASPSTPGASNLTSAGRRSHKKKDGNAPTPLRKVSTPNVKSEDTEMIDAPAPEATSAIKLISPVQTLTSHPGDDDPLLKSRVPIVPSTNELEALLAKPPSTYLEARGQLGEEDLRTPTRKFCEICGYWGRVKCLRCGSRCCALECLRTHQEDCFTRYGA